ncbi:MAG: EAL domain-containing protein [Proteobacteria bacterium]|nr:EAL domain-containing protein [Pseudomonadota bacterium]
MSEARRVLLLAGVMAAVAALVGGAAIGILYATSFRATEHRLIETARAQARLIDAVGRSDRANDPGHPDLAFAATLSKIAEAYRTYEGIGDSGELSLGRREGDRILFLLRQRQAEVDAPLAIASGSPLGEPMRRALAGGSGTMVGPDHRGETVLAAYEPAPFLGLGVVAKIDLAEVRRPFVKAGAAVVAIAVVVIAGATVLFFRIGNPMVRRLVESEARFRSAFEEAAHGMGLMGLDGRWLKVNQALCEIVGLSEEELLASDLRALLHPDDAEATIDRIEECVAGSCDSIQTEVRLRAKGGRTAWASLAVSVVRDPRRQPVSLIAQLHDISERKAEEVRIWRRASFDPVTGLPNRALFADRLNLALSRARREGRRLALVFLDLDRFKRVNDTVGHRAGDELLREVGARISNTMRASDTVARLAGDEFTAIVPEIVKARDAETVVRKLLDSIAAPFTLAGQPLSVTASAGVAFFPDDATDADALLQSADAAMYRAKRRGRNRYEYGSPEMYSGAREDARTERELARALGRGEFFLIYQPILNVRSGRVTAAEALLRWRHPERGTLAPDDFLALAERARLIEPICNWVLGEACRQVRAWAKAGLDGLSVAVNVTARECLNGHHTDSLRGILAETQIDPASLILEMTESVMFGDDRAAAEAIQEAKAMGVRFALDDFGAGQSSLGVLKKLPVDFLKIDGSFVRAVPHDPDAAALVGAILALARSLDLGVIGEGVESEPQLDFLRRHGCTFAQGFLVGRPVPPERFAEVASVSRPRQPRG